MIHHYQGTIGIDKNGFQISLRICHQDFSTTYGKSTALEAGNATKRSRQISGRFAGSRQRRRRRGLGGSHNLRRWGCLGYGVGQEKDEEGQQRLSLHDRISVR